MATKNILLAVSGLNPQVITEALYAFIMEERPIHEIHVITTRSGKDAIHAGLLASGTGALYRLLDEYEISREMVHFPPENIHVLKDSQGNELDDILSPEHNAILVETCMRLSWKLTKDPDTAVYFLIAGGRKTMSACLALSAQFYGRPQDRIYHVLVSPEFESSREFYYPPRINTKIRLKDDKDEYYFKDSKYAKIWLVPMPFVSVRSWLSEKDLEGPERPEDLLMSVVCDAPAKLRVDISRGKLAYCGREVDLSPALIAVYAFFAMRRKDCRCSKEEDVCEYCFPTLSEVEKDECRHLICGFFETAAQNSPTLPRRSLSEGGIQSIEIENLRQYRTKINAKIDSYFGHIAHCLRIESVGRRGEKRYGIRFLPQLIEIE
ncbi:CRISPR-associated protein, Csx3 family [Dissulfuribacter thermophilus]|uniref:CRISPR-associated protein, Csx3 family n=1 Tax=Dissulfuribacter thermophilus TaxID=1156395 RepID=A0A1B9F3H1_9BACT|nr:CRISPR-associated ring nuclease Csm6 [Dissulfuribacter thermophilus]OCC14487.1 CRISPR-associated protein, Csx3 family [Dissulfuribacter thermophilus]